MKIAIIGTHSTGKTTIIKNLQQLLRQKGHEVTVLQELARECPLPINEQSSLDAQKWILLNQISRETGIDHDGSMFITDRATIDNFAYMYRVASPLSIDHFERAAAEHMKSYDFVFKTRKLEAPAKEDGIRTTDLEFRDMIDRLINLLLSKHNVHYHLLPQTMNYQTHVNYILSHALATHKPQATLQTEETQMQMPY